MSADEDDDGPVPTVSSSIMDDVAKFDIPAVAAYLARGNSIKTLDERSKETMLHVAIRHMRHTVLYEPMFDFLLRHGIDINQANVNNDTPLHLAAHQSLPRIVKWLLLNDCFTALRNNVGELAVDLAAKLASKSKGVENVREETLTVLARWMHADKTTIHDIRAEWSAELERDKKSVLDGFHRDCIAAIRAKDFPRMMSALDKGIDVNGSAEEGPDSGVTLLMAAASVGFVKAARVLAKRGADFLKKDKSGQNVLHHAANIGFPEDHLAIMRLALENHLDPRHKDNLGRTAADIVGATREGRAASAIVEVLEASEREWNRKAPKAKAKKEEEPKKKARGKEFPPLMSDIIPSRAEKTITIGGRAVPVNIEKTDVQKMTERIQEMELKNRIKVGYLVACKVAGGADLSGVVKYVGRVHFADGLWIGVQLDKDEGKNNGTVMGRRYFVCGDKHGLFVRPDAVRVTDS